MTSHKLKLLAIVTMTIDHIAAIVGQDSLLTLFPSAGLVATFNILEVMRWIGRLAFPLFAFMIAEGCIKTRSMPRYLGRLALFAVLSEPFFYWAVNGIQNVRDLIPSLLDSLTQMRLHNVFVTLAVGALTVYIHQFLKKKGRLVWLAYPAAFLLALLAELAHSDYGFLGVALVFALYLAQTRASKMAVIVAWSVVLYIGDRAFYGTGFNWSYLQYSSILNCACAALAAVPIWFYNGQRGKPHKFWAYVYYPAHLFVLWLARFLIIQPA